MCRLIGFLIVEACTFCMRLLHTYAILYTYPIHLVAVEIRTRVRMCSLNVEYNIQIENRMFLIDGHGKNDVQSCENS